MTKIAPLTRLSDDEAMFCDEIRKFAESQIKPRIMEMDEAEVMAPDLIKGLFEMGLMGIEIPEKFGGAGGTFMMATLAVEELSKVDPAVAILADVQNTLVNNIFLNYGSPEQQETYFPQLVKDKVGCYCLTEPNSGSDAFALKTRARPDGDSYIIEGKKIFITNAKEAEIFLVFANVDPDKGYKGITAFVLDKGMPGLSIGKKEEKMGIRASSTCEVIMDNVKVPKSHIVGELGKGYKIAIGTLNEGRIGVAAQMLGLAQGAFAAAMKYAGERQQFGQDINSFQGVQFQLASLAVDIETAKLAVYNAARLKDAGLGFIKEAAIAKFHASVVAERVASRSLEVFGGYGFIKEFPAEKFYRDAKIGQLYEGTSNMQLQTIFRTLQAEMP